MWAMAGEALAAGGAEAGAGAAAGASAEAGALKMPGGGNTQQFGDLLNLFGGSKKKESGGGSSSSESPHMDLGAHEDFGQGNSARW